MRGARARRALLARRARPRHALCVAICFGASFAPDARRIRERARPLGATGLLSLAHAASRAPFAQRMDLLNTPGVAGLISLPLIAAIGYGFGTWYVERLGGMHPLGKVATNAVMLSVMAGFFWLWAAYKFLLKGDPDFGVVSFAIAFAATYRTASLCAAQICRDASRCSKSSAALLRMQVRLPAACFVPMVNYILVLVLQPTLPLSFQAYLIAGTITWSLSAIRGGWLLGDDLVVTSLRDENRRPRPKLPPNGERQALKYMIDQELSRA